MRSRHFRLNICTRYSEVTTQGSVKEMEVYLKVFFVCGTLGLFLLFFSNVLLIVLSEHKSAFSKLFTRGSFIYRDLDSFLSEGNKKTVLTFTYAGLFFILLAIFGSLILWYLRQYQVNIVTRHFSRNPLHRPLEQKLSKAFPFLI